MDVYCFSSENLTNIWAGYGARKWAVSTISATDMKTRETKSLGMTVGSFGLIWCSAPTVKAFTMPFRVATDVQWRTEDHIWPEPWSMPFGIEPLGSPRHLLRRDDAFKVLDCLKTAKSLTDVFFLGGTCAFVPSRVPDDDWEIILEELSDD